MSYKTWHYYGFGICTDYIDVEALERVQALVHKARNFEKEVQSIFAELDIAEPTLDDYLELDEDYRSGIAYVLRRVILECTGIDLSTCDDFDGRVYLIYMTDYPWNAPWRHRFLTERRVERVIRKYVSMITDTEFTVDYIEAENGG